MKEIPLKKCIQLLEVSQGDLEVQDAEQLVELFTRRLAEIEKAACESAGSEAFNGNFSQISWLYEVTLAYARHRAVDVDEDRCQLIYHYCAIARSRALASQCEVRITASSAKADAEQTGSAQAVTSSAHTVIRMVDFSP